MSDPLGELRYKRSKADPYGMTSTILRHVLGEGDSYSCATDGWIREFDFSA
jgi:hypothetical protein